MRIIYHKPVDTDNTKVIGTLNSTSGGINYYNLTNSPTWYSPCAGENYPIGYENEDIWAGFEIYGSETTIGTKKNLLYSNINEDYKKMITYSTYMKKTNSDGTYQNLYFSTLTEPDLYASYNGGNSWLNTYSQIIGDNQNGKYLMCNGYGDYNILEIFKNSSNATFRNGSTFNNKKVSLYGGNYIPVLTLKNKTKLIKNDFCDSSILGTKECPYKLECNEC